MAGRLQHSPAKIAQYLIIGLGLGVLPPRRPWPTYALHEPPTPDNVITVFNTVGKKHGKTMPDSETQKHHGIQVKVRSALDDIGYDKINEIMTTLDEDVLDIQVAIGEATYKVHNVVIVGDVIPLPKPQTATGVLPEVDEVRSVHVLNCLLSIRQLDLGVGDEDDDSTPVGGVDADFTFGEGEGTEISG